MARVTLDDLRNLIRAGTNWQEEGWEPPERVFDIKLPEHDGSAEPVMHSDLIGKTLSYEGREVTVNLDFDHKGYLVAIEFV